MKKVIEFYLSGDRVYSEREKAINQLHNNRGYGEVKGKRLFLSLIEAAYLIERGWIKVLDNGRELTFDEVFSLGKKRDEDFDIKFLVYKDLRDRGYIVKSGLKFGSHFRVYRKGAEHSDWLIWVLRENQKLSPNDITARARVAHGVRKSMIMAIVDEDNDIVYYKIEWTKF
ncbi:tRNA-intron lyase [Pyrococcus sp. ST04]|uniref:tRNA-intron lyase n=1 Tax=Pyrococcus sp. ST04 TaxID=1183377 RepID=UPI0002605A53|nr:tRNA-intron lyase [Pyrococcus sp. ST04]AFK22020.1 putative tRNA-splicing endonuclease subunit alpha [Pyrococcus sp. ST04]